MCLRVQDYHRALYSASLQKDLDIGRVAALYYSLGPTPRICIELLLSAKALKEYENGLEHVIANYTLDQLNQMDSGGQALAMKTTNSYKILLINSHGGLWHPEGGPHYEIRQVKTCWQIDA